MKIFQHADDFALIVEALTACICSRRATVAVRVAKWTELQKLTIRAEKTISIYFREMCKMRRKLIPKTNPGMPYLGKAFKMASPAKYLES